MGDDIFNFISAPMLTEEECHAGSLDRLSFVRPTFIDQWPAELSALSMPTQLIQIDAKEIGRALFDREHNEPRPQCLSDLAAQLDAALGWERKFFKLNSRSAKDAMWPLESLITCSGKEMLMVMGASERILDDLSDFANVPEQPAYIALREQVYGIRGFNEFRCFVKGGDLIAVTHYDYGSPAPTWIIKDAANIRAMIDRYFTERLKPTLHIDTVVFDIAMIDNDFMLIEINPYGLSDPCWFGSYAAVESATGAIQFDDPAEPLPSSPTIEE